MGRVLCIAVLLSGLAGPVLAQPQPPRAVPVGTVTVEKRPIARTGDFVGRIEAVNKVEVRARVTGFLEAVLFTDGDVVAEGAPLYRIEKGPFEAAVQQAQGALLRTRGVLQNATVARQRAEDLVRTNAGSIAVRDQRVAEEQAAQGDLATAEANLRTAEINLGYTDITSPIAGRIGRTRVTKGNVVGPDSGVLAEIVSENPMYVTFPVSQREFLTINRTKVPEGAGAPTVKLTFSDGSVYGQMGKIDFIDVTVDRSTDTVLVRATVPNPEDKLIDGTLVRVTVQAGQAQDRVLVPQAALIADQQGAYVFVVEDGKAVVRRLKLGDENGPFVIVQEGLSGGEQVIVDGLQGLRPGTPVLASPVTPPLANRS